MPLGVGVSVESGLYAISFLKLYPTDGEGQFFWNLSNKEQNYKCSCDTFYQGNYACGYPAFLVPTQSNKNYNEECIQMYRQKLKEGKNLGGIVYYLDGYFGALLDGHHRATACLLEDKDFYCLTIIPVNGWYQDIDKEEEGVFIGGEKINFKRIPNNIKIKLKEQEKFISLQQGDVEKYINMIDSSWKVQNWDEDILRKAKGLPTYIGVASLQWVKDLSDERIDAILHKDSYTQNEELELILMSLIALNDSRAKDICIKICSLENYIYLWEESFIYLSGIKAEEIEDFFVDFLINDVGTRPYLTNIATEYLSG